MIEGLNDCFIQLRPLITGQQGPKHAGVCVLKHCNSKEVYAFVGHIVTNES